MSSFTHQQILDQIRLEGFVPLFTHTDEETCKNVLRASYEAGTRLFEFTNRNENSFDIFIELRRFCNKELPGMILGIGTIKDSLQAEQFIHAGADFLISPLIMEGIHTVAKKLKTLWIPGCATPTEIGLAENWGIGLVKIFPARQLGGPPFIHAVRAVFPKMEFLTTGGVEPTEDDIREWFKSGVTAIGVGSKLFPQEWLENKQYDQVTLHVKKIVQYIQNCKSAK